MDNSPISRMFPGAEGREENMRKDALRRVAAWLDFTCPGGAPHLVEAQRYYSHDSELDMARISVTPLSFPPRSLAYRDHLAALARQALEGQGLRIVRIPGADFTPITERGQSQDMTQCERRAAVAQISRLVPDATPPEENL